MTVAAANNQRSTPPASVSPPLHLIDRSSPPNVVQIARILFWILLVALAFPTMIGSLCCLMGDRETPSYLSPFAALFALFLWLVKKQNSYTRSAWTIQLIAFLIGLLAVPTGTIISACVLWAWFKPETKVWFGIR